MQNTILDKQLTQVPSSQQIVVFDENVYSLTAIKKAAYKFTHKAFIKIEESDNKSIKIHFSFAENIPSSEHHIILGEFSNEVLDQDLRETISKETEDIRKLIMAQAFSKTSLID